MIHLAAPSIGTFHTAVSVAAVLAGFIALVWHKEISPRSAWGRIYILATFLSCVTALFIYNHGGFGIPHGLAIATLLMLRVGSAAGERHPRLETIAFSTTYFFHMIPGIVETSTRLPLGAPLVADRESPILLQAVGVAFALFLVGTSLQVLRLRRRTAPSAAPPTTVAASA